MLCALNQLTGGGAGSDDFFVFVVLSNASAVTRSSSRQAVAQGKVILELSGLAEPKVRHDGAPFRMSIDNESDQVKEGHSVDALATRGDEGRDTLR